MEKAAQTLRLYLGPYGCQVKLLDYEHLLDTAKLTFNVAGTNLVDVAYKVKGLGTRERSARAKEAIQKHWPTPNVLWPANAPIRRWLSTETF